MDSFSCNEAGYSTDACIFCMKIFESHIIVLYVWLFFTKQKMVPV